MPNPTDPPRPGLTAAVRDYIAACTWDSQQARVENSSGVAVVAWLNQTGTPGVTAIVQWEAGTASDLGNAVPGTITQQTFDIIKNGTFNVNTGIVTYGGKSYRFCFLLMSGQAQMSAYAV